MKNMLYKELKLAAAGISYFFLASALFTMIPGYPILMSGGFLTLGLFYSFQSMREKHDIEYSLLLPVSKADIVKGKYAFVLLLEGIGFVLCAILTVVRMTFLKASPVYLENALMGANLVYLGELLLIFGLFNAIFVRGFFKTGYYIGKPFLCYGIPLLLLIGLAEAAHHIPGLGLLNAFGTDEIEIQLIALACGVLLFVLLTFVGIRQSVKSFEKVDL